MQDNNVFTQDNHTDMQVTNLLTENVFNMGTSLPLWDSDIIHARCSILYVTCKGRNRLPYVHNVTIYPGNFFEEYSDL